MTTPYNPLHLKYRPQTLIDLVGQPAIQTCLTNALVSGQIAPAYCLTLGGLKPSPSGDGFSTRAVYQ